MPFIGSHRLFSNTFFKSGIKTLIFDLIQEKFYKEFPRFILHSFKEFSQVNVYSKILKT